MGVCAKCKRECKVVAKGCCKSCYDRAYYGTRLYSAKDDAGKFRAQARKIFINALRESVTAIVSLCEMTESPAVWAEKNLRLPPSKSFGRNGRIDLSIMPEAIELLELLRNPSVKQLVFASSAQSNKSLLLQMAVGYLAVVRGDSIVYGLPSVSLQKSVPMERIQPLLDLSRIRHEMRHGSIVFDGKNTLDFVLLTSRNQLAEKTARVTVLDEIDELPDLAFSPEQELSERSRIYPDSLQLLASTPKRMDRGIMWHYGRSRQYAVAWECPECKGEFVCEVDAVRSRDPEEKDSGKIIERHLGYVACPHCGIQLDDSHHLGLVKSQRLKCLTPERGFQAVGVRKTIIHTAFKNFSDVLAKRTEVEGDAMLFSQFMSNWAALPQEQGLSKSDIDNPIHRGSYLRGEPPKDSIGWTAGVDVQGDCLFVSCLAFSPRGVHQFWSQRIDRDRNDNDGVIRGLMHLIHDRPWSGKLPYLGMAIDAGFSTPDVMRWVAKVPLAIAVKGDGSAGMSLPFKLSGDGRTHILQHAYWQEMLQSHLNNGTLELPDNAFAWVEQHLRAEVKRTVIDPKTKMPKHAWCLRSQHSQNHIRDCCVYALFLGQQKGLCNIKVKPSATQAVSPQPQQPPMASGFKRIPIRGVGKRERW